MIHSKEVMIEEVFQKNAPDNVQIRHREVSRGETTDIRRGLLSVAEAIAETHR